METVVEAIVNRLNKPIDERYLQKHTLSQLRRVPRSHIVTTPMGPFYKIVERKNGKLFTLFKTYSKEGDLCGGVTRELPVGPLLGADIREVRDGGSGTKYLSGWHLLNTVEDCHEYLKKFKNTETKAIIECRVLGELWMKEHSRSEVYLAEAIRVVRIVEVIGSRSN